ncbi:MAG TPA: hypothetical protein VJ935_01495 [Acidimicrobiia bacterium]|nr:hypothetical protein [Acidimicrobiia bacterium]
MATTELRLPAEKPAMARFGRLIDDDREKFLKDLLGAIWECDEEGVVPERISRLIHAWDAHIRFEENSGLQAYKEELRTRLTA